MVVDFQGIYFFPSEKRNQGGCYSRKVHAGECSHKKNAPGGEEIEDARVKDFFPWKR